VERVRRITSVGTRVAERADHTDVGQPCVGISGVASGSGERTRRKWKFGGPAGAAQPVLQVVQLGLENLDAEGADFAHVLNPMSPLGTLRS
jgi:hypothetical protein